MSKFRSLISPCNFGMPERIAEDLWVEATVSVREGGVTLKSVKFIEVNGEPADEFLKSMMIDVGLLKAAVTEAFDDDTANTMWEFVEGFDLLCEQDESFDPEAEYGRLCEALGGSPCNHYAEFESLFTA